LKKLFQIFIIILPLIITNLTQDTTHIIRVLYLSIFLTIILLVFILLKQVFNFSLLKNSFSILYFLIVISYLISLLINGFTAEATIVLLKMYLFYLFYLFSSFLFKNFGFEFILKPILYFSITVSLIYFIQFFDFYQNISGLFMDTTNID